MLRHDDPEIKLLKDIYRLGLKGKQEQAAECFAQFLEKGYNFKLHTLVGKLLQESTALWGQGLPSDGPFCPSEENPWWVYVLRSETPKMVFYVGCTTNPERRLRQHNGEITGGAKYTRARRPWTLVAVWGPYQNQSEAQSAEAALKKQRGLKRVTWPEDSLLRRGLGPHDPRVTHRDGLLSPAEGAGAFRSSLPTSAG